MTEIKISIARDFSPYPGGRFKGDGPFSGETFREEILIPALERSIEDDSLLVIVLLDGVAGFGSSFLEEAFGGVVRTNRFTKKQVTDNLTIRADQDDMKEFVTLANTFIEESEKS